MGASTVPRPAARSSRKETPAARLNGRRRERSTFLGRHDRHPTAERHELSPTTFAAVRFNRAWRRDGLPPHQKPISRI